MNHLRNLVACALLAPTLALADPPPAPTADATYAVATEQIAITGADAKLLEQGEAAGGYSLLYRGGQGMGMRIGTHSRSSYRNLYRFTGADGAELSTGVCRIRTEGQSAFGFHWDQQSAQLYACDMKDKPADRFGIEVAVPAFKQGHFSLGALSVQASQDIPDAELQAVLKAKMAYDGVAYEAAPTGFARATGLSQRRIVQGFTITRDGAPVGRIDFGRDSIHRGSIVAPTAESDGRQAVLFFAHQLSIMPDLYSSTVRAEVFP